MAELHDLSALEQARRIRAREVSPVELLEHYQRRADRLDPVVGAYITRADELALEQARAAAGRVLRARSDEDLGPLFGTVVPVKDLALMAGVRTTLGSAVYDLVPARDDNVVARMRAAGLVLSGKTNTPEFGLPCYTENAVAPPARTPWDLSRSAGGSSGGAAAAVAAGLASAAHGSDGGGSIRIPASVTGLVGLKPSRGRVSNGPLPDSVGELGHQGVLARTVRDAAALLDVMSGAFAGDPFPAPALAPGAMLAACDVEPARLRIGRYCQPVVARTDVDRQVLAVYEATSELLTGLGHVVEDMPPPYGPDQVGAFETVWSVLAALTPVPAADEPRLAPLTRWLRERGRAATGVGLAGAVSTMRQLARSTIAAGAAYDVVLTPTLAALPAAVGGLRDDEDPAADFEAQKRFTPFTATYNVAGLPAVSLPLGQAQVDGVALPVGVQLVGRQFGEPVLLGLAAALETARPWDRRRPPLW